MRDDGYKYRPWTKSKIDMETISKPFVFVGPMSRKLLRVWVPDDASGNMNVLYALTVEEVNNGS